jgi:hypothetical protein
MTAIVGVNVFFPNDAVSKAKSDDGRAIEISIPAGAHGRIIEVLDDVSSVVRVWTDNLRVSNDQFERCAEQLPAGAIHHRHLREEGSLGAPGMIEFTGDLGKDGEIA